MKIKKSYILAALIIAIIAAWMLSGELIVGGQEEHKPAATPASVPAAQGKAANDPFRVQVRVLNASRRVAELVVRGHTQVLSRVELKVETPGLVEALPRRKGSLVKQGETVCQIARGAREIKLAAAKAQLAKTELELEAATELSLKGFAAETRVRTTQAALDAAKAALADAELDLKRTSLSAPFDGVIEQENAEVGAYLNTGSICVTMATRDPMLVIGQVSERDVAQLRTGMTGHAVLVTGETITGRIRFISPSAYAATRTFLVELEIPNPQGNLRDGVTAQMRIALQPVTAHNVPSNYLTLDDKGRVGVRSVDGNQITQFMPVNIIGDSEQGVWVTGLPDTVTVITVGQDYVTSGQKVTPVPQTADRI